ncbi:MAG: BON domain-containing protein [Phycisphaerae bacterium]|jgi:osmotically-inducible protein OsmY
MVAETHQIKNAIDDVLSRDQRVEATRVSVDVDGSTVKLSGCVSSHSAARAAADDARRACQSLNVINELAVVPTERRGDEEIARRVLAALERSGAFAAGAITVEVRNGTITLTGSVEDSLARARARGIALCVAGVLAVDNHLVIGGDPPERMRKGGRKTPTREQ